MGFLNFRFDRTSFWYGFLAGVLFTLFIVQLRALLPRLFKFIREQVQAARESLQKSTETRLRNDVLNLAQHRHLAAPLFALDEILIPPKVLAPSPLFLTPDHPLRDEITQRTIPYLPDWPELGAAYHAPTLSMPEALAGGMNIVVLGRPGTGKTVALAHLASLFARQDEAVAKFNGLFPVYVHAADVISKIQAKDTAGAQFTAEVLINAVSSYASTMTLPRLGVFIRNSLEMGRAILILDGVDEFPPETVARVKEFLGVLLETYPTLKIVTAASVDNYGGLDSLGFAPLTLASWNQQEQEAFVAQWEKNWSQHIAPDALSATEFVDTLLLRAWMLTRDPAITPLELTLKTWGAFAGDIIGSDLPDLLDAHLLRMSVNIPSARDALEQLAAQMITKLKPEVTLGEAQKLVSAFEKQISAEVKETAKAAKENETAKEDETAKGAKTGETAKVTKVSQTARILTQLTNAGLVSAHANSTLTLANPVFTYYLAGSYLARLDTLAEVASQPDWIGKSTTLSFAGYYGDLADVVGTMLAQNQETPLNLDLFTVARWLRLAAKTASWRPSVMRNLAGLMQKEYAIQGTSARAMMAMALSGDAGIGALFRQFLKSERDSIRSLAALGCGVLADVKAVKELTALAGREHSEGGGAACLALVSIGTREALNTVASVLLNGSEEMRRIAAEALANHPIEGYPTLQEGISVDDLLVRRACVFGLQRLKEPWVKGIFEKMAVQDAQWVVRNTAAHALDQFGQKNPLIPESIPPLRELPWLIAYAGKQGIGIADEKQGLAMILQALEYGEPEERLNALSYLRWRGVESAISKLYGLYYASQAQTREAIYDVLWHLSSSGIKLPNPIQYGLG